MIDGINKYIFYHIFLYDKINIIVNEQLKRLIDSGILEVSNLHIIILDNYNGEYKLDDENITLIEEIPNCEIHHETGRYYEMITHSKIYDHAINHVGNYLYIHTKGCTRVNQDPVGDINFLYKNVVNWRYIMEHFVIDQWEICNDSLSDYDIVGSNYLNRTSDTGGFSHYSGNFWWATSSFINKLPNPIHHLNHHRFYAENWIGRIRHKALCLNPIPDVDNYITRGCIYTEEKDYLNCIIRTEYINDR